MRIVFATTQGIKGSTVVGRVLPLARRWAREHDVDVLVLGKKVSSEVPRLKYHKVGHEPFIRTARGKVRMGGIELVINMVAAAIRTTIKLFELKPDAVVIVKPLPANVLGVAIYVFLTPRNVKVVLDSDDFELTANKLSSGVQRGAIHWSERLGAKIAQVIVVVSPFLEDHFKLLVKEKKKVVMIPTGLSLAGVDSASAPAATISYVGSVSISSGHRVDMLADILKLVRKEIQDARMLIAGGGDNIQDVQRDFRLAELSGAVEFRGRFSESELPQILKETAVLVDPIDASVAQRAKSSFRVALAGVSQVPVVSSNVGIRPYWLPDELHERFFAKPDDAKDYANKIVGLLREPLTNEDKEKMKQRAARYNWDKLANDYIKYL